MLAEKHSRGPRLPTTTRSHIFVHLERTGENAIEIDSRNTTGLEGRQWSNVLADCDWVHQRGRWWTAHCERVVAVSVPRFESLDFCRGSKNRLHGVVGSITTSSPQGIVLKVEGISMQWSLRGTALQINRGRWFCSIQMKQEE